MHKKLVACLVAVAVVVGCVLFFVGGGRGGGPGRPRAEERAEAQAIAPALVAAEESTPESAPAPAAREAGRTDAESTPSGSVRGELAGLTGRVVESDGTPVAAIRVALLEFDGSTLFDGAALGESTSLELEETLTDEEGRFLLGGAAARAFHGLGVDLGGPRGTVRVLDHALVHRARTDIGDVVLAPFGVLTGRVVDASGAPVAGARVRCGPFPEEILAGHPWEFRSDSVLTVNLTMMGEEGQWIVEPPEWVRALLDRLPVPTTETRADGTFRLEGIALAEVVGGIDKRGYVGVPLGPLDLSGGAHDVGDVVLARGRTVRGVVEDPSGDAVAGAEVYAGAEIVPGIVAILQPCGRADADGRFELSGVAETGQIVAAARRARHEAWGTTVNARHEGVTVELEGTVSLTVNVRDEAGTPLSGADVRLEPMREADTNPGFGEVLAFLPKPASPPGTCVEAEPGRYVVAGLGAGRYQVTARVTGRAPGFAETECFASESEITVTCTAGRRVELTVVAAATGEPIAGARASVLRAASSGFVKLCVQETGPDGRASLGPLPALAAEAQGAGFMESETLLRVQHPRHGDHSATLDPTVSPLVVALHDGGVLAGRVHWGGAVPTRIYMLTVDPRGADGFLELFSLPRFAVSDLAGEFRCANLGPGTHGVTLTERFLDKDPLGMIVADFDPPTLYSGEVEIRPGETTELVIDLTPTGRGATAQVVGRVRFDGRSLEGAQVSVEGNEDVEVVTDAGGRFETPLFSVRGRVHIRIHGDVKVAGNAKRSLQLHSSSVELEDGDVHELDLDLYPFSVPVRVVADASGEPVAAVEVSARIHTEGRGFDMADQGTTNAAGEVELLLLEPGKYALRADADGFGQAADELTLPAEGLTEPALLRLPRAVVCAGRVVVDVAADGPERWSFLQVHAASGARATGARLEAPDYTFTLEGLAPGEYKATIWMGGKLSEEQSFVLGPDGDENLVLVYTPRADDQDDDEDE